VPCRAVENLIEVNLTRHWYATGQQTGRLYVGVYRLMCKYTRPNPLNDQINSCPQKKTALVSREIADLSDKQCLVEGHERGQQVLGLTDNSVRCLVEYRYNNYSYCVTRLCVSFLLNEI